MADDEEMKKRASRLIRAGEISGGDESDAGLRAGFVNNKAYKPHIPDGGTPGKAGLTLGHGHDLGQSTEKEIDDVYGPQTVGSGGGPYDYGPQGEIFTAQQRAILKKFAGKKKFTKKEKRAALKVTKTITMSYEQAVEVFEKRILPLKGIEPARQAFPGFDNLPSLQQAAIVDRVYMRGPGVSTSEANDGGTQMLVDLKTAVFNLQTKEVYAQVKNMEALHHKAGTIARAKRRTELALEGYMQTTRTGPR